MQTLSASLRTILKAVRDKRVKVAFLPSGIAVVTASGDANCCRLEVELGCMSRMDAIALIRNKFGLTPAEGQIAYSLAQGATSTEISRNLGISVHTAKRHTESTYRKLGIRTREELEMKLRARVRNRILAHESARTRSGTE